jgi:hypothetical protein
MEDVRSVLVDQNAGFVVVVVGVAADVRPLVADDHFLPAVRRQPLRNRGAGEASTNHQIVEHRRSFQAGRRGWHPVRDGGRRRCVFKPQKAGVS